MAMLGDVMALHHRRALPAPSIILHTRFLIRRAAGCRGAPPIARRRTADQYRRVIADVFGPTIKVEGRFEPGLREQGLESWSRMSGFELSVGLDDEQIAALCTYVRSSLGNRAGPADAADVAKQH
jgi:mono/diheme cytochrome c family protein